MRFIKKTGIIVFICVLVTAVIGCSSTSVKNKEGTSSANSEKLNNELSITGFNDGDIKISMEDIKKFNPVEESVKGKNSSGKDVNLSSKGTLFEDILKDSGKTQKDIGAVRLVAGDGYSIEVPEGILKNRDIILAYELNGKELEENKGLRVVIPNERAMYWVKNLVRIEVLKSVEKEQISKVIFLETAVSQLSDFECEYEKDVMDKAVKSKELIEKFCGDNISNTLHIKASDGLEKNEQFENFIKGDLKTTGVDSPLFFSEELPIGMQVKDILWFSCGQASLVSYSQCNKMFESKELDDKKGIPLKDVLKEVELQEGKSYKLTSYDGYSVELSQEEIENTILYINNKDQLKAHVEGQKSKSVKGILSIEIIKAYSNK